VAEAKRDRSVVSLAWLAVYSLEGDEDADFVRQYSAEAREQLGRYIHDQRSTLDPEAEQELADLLLFLVKLEEALTAEGDTAFELTLTRRAPTASGGRPRGVLPEERRHRIEAAAIAERECAKGLLKPQAIEQALDEMRAKGRGAGLTERTVTREFELRRRLMKTLEGRSRK
jgi:hypothetical protein